MPEETKKYYKENKAYQLSKNINAIRKGFKK